MLWCSTTSGYLYPLSEAVDVTSEDNGGRVVGISLTYTTAINDINDNAIV